MGDFLKNLVKVALVGGLAYGAYKVGEHNGLEKGKRSVMSDDEKEEIDHLKDLIEDLEQALGVFFLAVFKKVVLFGFLVKLLTDGVLWCSVHTH